MSMPPKDDASFPYKNVETAPIVYFDFIAAYGVVSGIIQIELAAHTLVPNKDGADGELVTVARLRCSRVAFNSKRSRARGN
jgi:hypothetical protein